MTYFETLGAAIDGAFDAALAKRAIIYRPDEFRDSLSNAVNYGQTAFISSRLTSLRGKPTKKFFHVSIYRLDSGRYELTTYVL